MLFFKKIFKEKDIGLTRVIDCIQNDLDFEPLNDLELHHLKVDLTNFDRTNLLYTAIDYLNVNAVKKLINNYHYNLAHIYASRLYSDYPNRQYHTNDQIVKDLAYCVAPLFFFNHSFNLITEEPKLLKQYEILEFLSYNTPLMKEPESYIKSEVIDNLFKEISLGTNLSGDLSYNLTSKFLRDGIITANPEKEIIYGDKNNILSLVPNWNQNKTVRLIDLLFEYGANPYFRINGGPSLYDSLLLSNITNHDHETQKIIFDIEKRMFDIELPEDCHYNQLIHLICSNDSVENFKNNISNKYDIYMTNKYYQNILFTLLPNTKDVSNNLIMHMLNCNYNLLEQDINGDTNLHLLFSKRPSLIPFLLLSHKDLNFDILNNKGQSPKTLLNDPNGLYSPLIAEYEKNIISSSIKDLDTKLPLLKQRL